MIVDAAQVYKAGTHGATLTRTSSGIVFAYEADYLAYGGPPIASTLPLNTETGITPAGAVPPFFAGLLPEGRRLGALRRTVKTSADDELSLLAAIGADAIGDVTIRADKTPPLETTVEVQKSFGEIRFADLLDETGIGGRPSLAGIQDKVSAAMISLPLRRQGERYILKLNPPENPHLVENEAYFINLAQQFRLPAVEARLIADVDGEPGLLVTRFDRVTNDGDQLSLAVEDACQILGRWPADKYAVTMEETAASVVAITTAPTIAARDIIRQVAYAWLTGNGDLHAKNLSVVDEPGIGNRMSPAYDLPSTVFYGDDTMALTIGGRDTLTRARLIAFGQGLRLTKRAVERTIDPLVHRAQDLPERLSASDLPFNERTIAKVTRQLRARHRVLQG